MVLFVCFLLFVVFLGFFGGFFLGGGCFETGFLSRHGASLQRQSRAGKMFLYVKAPAMKSEDLSSVTGTYMVNGENN